MAGRHYALVLSPISYARRAGMTIICPITSRVRRHSHEVFLPDDLLPEKKGVGKVTSIIIADAVRQVDFREREMEFVAEAPKELVELVLDVLLTAMEEEET